MDTVIIMKDAAYKVSTLSPNAIVYLEELGYGFSDAFEIAGIARDPDATRAKLEEARAYHAEHPGEDFPSVRWEYSLTGIRDHLTAILRENGEDVSPEDVGKAMDVSRLPQYASQILDLGSEAFGPLEDSKEPEPLPQTSP